MKDLRSIDSNALLQKLDADWRKFIQSEERLKGNAQRLRSFCLYESKALFGITIVSQGASTAICDERFAMNEDQLSIAKPTSRESEVYKRTRGLIADLDRLKPSGQTAAAASGVLKPFKHPASGLGLRKQTESLVPVPNARIGSWTSPAERMGLFTRE